MAGYTDIGNCSFLKSYYRFMHDNILNIHENTAMIVDRCSLHSIWLLDFQVFKYDS